MSAYDVVLFLLEDAIDGKVQLDKETANKIIVYITNLEKRVAVAEYKLKQIKSLTY